jgi:triosephosphate isomerase
MGGTHVRVGAQDLATEDSGPFTGEVSGAELSEIGCTHVEVGHVERRTLFGETDSVAAAKVSAALRNCLVPILCVGETSRTDPATTADVCQRVRIALAEYVEDFAIIYGGSAGPGLLTDLGGNVDGLFFGRFAHDPQVVLGVLAKAAAHQRRATGTPC